MQTFDRHRLGCALLTLATGHVVAQSSADSQPVPTVVVTGTGERGYGAGKASTANKTDTPLLETPFSVEIVPNQVLKDQQAINLRDATRNVSGVQANYGYGDLYEAFALRGFETNNTLRNGMRVAGGVGRSSVDVANIDSVEVLKGPAAMLYGRIEPGGLINVVTKRPQAQAAYSIEQLVGSDSLFRTTLDATGPVDADGHLLYRGIFSYFDADSFIDHAPHGRTQFLAPSLTWRPNADLEVNLDIEARDVRPLTGNGIVAIGDRPANIPITTYLGGDEGDYARVRRGMVALDWSYRLDRDWKLRNGVAWVTDSIDFEEFFGGSIDESTGDFSITPWFDKRRSHGLNTFLDLTGHLEGAGIAHTVLVGLDYYRLSYDDVGFVNGWVPVDTTNIYSPTYFRPTAWGAHETLRSTPPDWTSVGYQQWTGLYLQDQMKVGDALHLLVGGRYDWAQARAGSITLEYAPPGSTLADVPISDAKENKFSPRLGALYQFTPTLAAYANYVESLGTWGTGLGIKSDIDGHPLPAERSKSYEAGVKAEFAAGLTSTLALYEITKTNMATRDLSSPDPTALRATGEARSRGVEFDVSGELTKQLSLIANYAYTDAVFTRDDSGLQGNRIANVPRHSGGLWAKLRPTSAPLSLGAGIFARGQRQGDNENTFQMPGYATVDAFAAYAFTVAGKRVFAQLNVNNLFDRRYFINSNVYDASPRFGVMPGQPRTVVGSVRLEL